MIVFTICAILLLIEWGIFMRSREGDVEASRALLDGNLKLLMGSLLGFGIGKSMNQNKP